MIYLADNMIQKKDFRYITYITSWEIYGQCSRKKKSAYLCIVIILLYYNSSEDFYTQIVDDCLEQS